MKKITTLILILGISSFAFGQNSTINYKALIKDNLGNVVANQTVSVQFTILANGSPVYVETHSPTTDANGIMIVDIGSGTTVDVFVDIDWSTNTTLKTEIDITGGTTYTDMGTTEFKSVPYALNAGNTAFSTTNNVTSNAPGDIGTDNFVFGSTELNHNTSFGIFDYDTRMFFNKSRGAFRAGATNSQGTASNNGTVWNDGSLGLYSFATGLNTLATNEYTTALGYFTQASGRFSTAIGNQTKALNISTLAMGYSTTASGENSTAIGDETTASGNSSTSFGYRTRAEAYNSTAFGRYNIGTGNPTTWIETDPLFEIGNGPNDITFTNALTVLKNGTITAPSFDLNEITDEKALVTKEYADALVSGLEAIDESNGIGWRLKGRDPANYGNIGLNAVDISISTSVSTTKGATGQGSFAAGSATASGFHSFAMGVSNTEASNDMSFAFGQSALATGNNSHAFGYNVTASGDRSFISGFDGSVSGTDAVAFGENANAAGENSAVLGGIFNTTSNSYTTTIGGANNIASGEYSTAAGYTTKAQANNVFTIGRFNIGGGDPNDWVAEDPLFEIGNGTFNVASNAFTVLKNGTITAPSFDLAEITDPKALVTKEYVDSGAGASGLEQITEVINLPGWRLIGQNPTRYGNIGYQATDLSYSGIESETLGATGARSFATGFNTTASDNQAVAMGFATIASGIQSVALGRGTIASGSASTAIGAYNIDDANAAFMIGNGVDDANRANAFTVMQNGQTIVNMDSPSFIHALLGLRSQPSGTNSDSSGVFGQNIVDDFYGIGVQGIGGWRGLSGSSNGLESGVYVGVYGESYGTNTGTNYGVYGSAVNGANNYAVYANGNLAYTGTLINASDRKVKTNISTINNSLKDIMRLNPTSYLIRENYQKTMNMSNTPQFGFIAQELQEVFPYLVSRNIHSGATKQEASIEYLGVNYIGLIPVLTKGIQEQQATIETLEEKVERQEQVIASLVARLEALEKR